MQEMELHELSYRGKDAEGGGTQENRCRNLKHRLKNVHTVALLRRGVDARPVAHERLLSFSYHGYAPYFKNQKFCHAPSCAPVRWRAYLCSGSPLEALAISPPCFHEMPQRRRYRPFVCVTKKCEPRFRDQHPCFSATPADVLLMPTRRFPHYRRRSRPINFVRSRKRC